MRRRVEWLPAAGGDIIGMGSVEHAERVYAAVENYATHGTGILSLDKSSGSARLYVRGAPYFVILHIEEDVVVVERVVERY